jgi:hypothetical protein
VVTLQNSQMVSIWLTIPQLDVTNPRHWSTLMTRVQSKFSDRHHHAYDASSNTNPSQQVLAPTPTLMYSVRDLITRSVISVSDATLVRFGNRPAH